MTQIDFIEINMKLLSMISRVVFSPTEQTTITGKFNSLILAQTNYT